MKTSAFRSFLMVCLLALSSLAFADDAEIAGKLKGEWTGDWTIDKYAAKFVLIVTEVAGTNLKGEGQWYAGKVGGDAGEGQHWRTHPTRQPTERDRSSNRKTDQTAQER